eukprot:8904176-Pyramimonas_sp.AAC.1
MFEDLMINWSNDNEKHEYYMFPRRSQYGDLLAPRLIHNDSFVANMLCLAGPRYGVDAYVFIFA